MKRDHWVSSALSLIGVVHIGARALHCIVWLYPHLSYWGGGGYFTHSNNFYLPSLRLEEGGGMGSAQHPVTHALSTFTWRCGSWRRSHPAAKQSRLPAGNGCKQIFNPMQIIYYLWFIQQPYKRKQMSGKSFASCRDKFQSWILCTLKTELLILVSVTNLFCQIKI